MGLRLIRVLLGVPGLLATVACRIITCKLDSSVGGSGPHDFAVRNPRLVAARIASIASRANTRDDREAPLFVGRGTRQSKPLICPTAQARRLRQNNPTGNLCVGNMWWSRADQFAVMRFPPPYPCGYRGPMSPAWFLAALLPTFVSQMLRLQYHDAAGWIFWDYAGRLCALAVLAAIPAARAIAFRREARRLPLWKLGLSVVGITLASIALIGLERPINAALSMTVLGHYPRSTGWLHLVDVTFGLRLIARSPRCTGLFSHRRLAGILTRET